jgi:ligand-binding sensor domain-containing protein/two-component sensor histidine kinase
MRKPPVINLLTALALLCAYRQGFPQILPFDHYSIQDGLPSNWITSIFQDSRGYLWIGADGGLSVYDGVSFRTYGKDDGLPVGHVWSIRESRKSPGTLLVGTHGGGLSKIADGKITSLTLDKNYAANVVTAILEDHEGVLWCGAAWGIYQVRHDSASYFSAVKDSGAVSFIFQTPDSLIWISIRQSLYRYSPRTRRTERLDFDLPPTTFSCMLEDGEGMLWLGAKDGTLYRLQHGGITAKRKLPFGDLRAVLDDKEGYLWFATPQGIVKVAKQNFPEGEIVNYDVPNGLLDTDLYFCLIDRENNLWFASKNQGLFKLSERNFYGFPFKGLDPDLLNRSAVVDERGHLFVASGEGLWEVWKNRRLGWQKFLHRPDRGGLSGEVHSVDIAGDGRLWVAYRQSGVAGYALTAEQEKPANLSLAGVLKSGRDLPHDPPRGAILGIFIDRDDQLWCSLWSVGLVQVDLNARKLRGLYVEELGESTPQAVCQDMEGNIWVGTFRSGLFAFKPQAGKYAQTRHFTPQDGLASDQVRSLVQRRNGELWIGSRFDGISIYKDGKFEKITTKDGLLNNAIWALAEDDEGRIWIATSVGLQYTAPDNSRRFFTHRRLTGRHVGAVGIISGRQAVWSVSPEELTIYEYGRKSLEGAPPPVYVTGLRVNGQERGVAGGMKFSHDENLCAFFFNGLSFKGGQPVQYKYRLRGLDDGWQGPTEQRAVTFASLHPGTYTFEVIAINAEGVESAAPASLTFTIQPPFWQRWWFIALCLLILGSVLYGIHIVRLDRLLEIEKIRSRIATDLHDDIGAGLTHIGLLSQVTLQKSGIRQRLERDDKLSEPNDEVTWQISSSAARELGTSMERVGSIARELSAAMSDVVWSINPQHDSGEALQRRLSVFAHEICRAKNIALNFAVSDQIAGLKLHPELRRNLLLIVKEALHNAVKYSGSPSVAIDFSLNGKNIVLTIADQGTGFDVAGAKNGNGLNNMRSRAEKLGGVCEIVSLPGQGGTRVTARVPYKKG